MEPNGAVDFVNQRWMDYMGLSLKEERRTDAPSYPEDLQSVGKNGARGHGRGELEDEMRLRREREYRWFSYAHRAVRDERENILGGTGVSIDIEDRKRAEEPSNRASGNKAT